MKKIVLALIKKYKEFTVDTPPRCRYHPSCSTYAKEAFEKKNFLYATILSIWRILRCNPFSKGGYDPVPTNKTKGKT